MESYTQQSDKKKISITFLAVGGLLVLGIGLLTTMLVLKVNDEKPTIEETKISTQMIFDTAREQMESTESSVGATAEDALNSYYEALSGGHVGVIMDEWATESLAAYINNRLMSGNLNSENWIHLNQNFSWEIMDVSALNNSNFQIAFIKNTMGSEEVCERVELANPENTGDHWRISHVSIVSCNDFILVDKIATPTQKAAVFVPEVTWKPCGGTFESRIFVGMTAYVSTDPALPNRVRDDASLDNIIRGEMDPGEAMWIIDGPKCADGWVWWKIRSQLDGLEGWTSEGDQEVGEDEQYWIVPSGLYK